MLSTITRTTARTFARPVSARTLAVSARGVHTLPELPYAYDVFALVSFSISQVNTSLQALEPHISKEIMTLHHTKHHQTYVNGLNAAEAAYAKGPDPKEAIALQPALKFNGGGHINHSLFWKNLAPASEGGGQLSDGKLKETLIADFGSIDKFKSKFNAATAAIQGSGWGWLVCDIFF